MSVSLFPERKEDTVILKQGSRYVAIKYCSFSLWLVDGNFPQMLTAYFPPRDSLVLLLCCSKRRSSLWQA